MIVYPFSGHVTDSDAIFFIGSAAKKCIINDQEIELSVAGNFAPVFNLKFGDNLFHCVVDGQKFEILVKRIEVKTSELTHIWRESQYKPIALKRICVDPGHGGRAFGTQSPKGIKEKDLNLQVANLLKRELVNNGFDVIVTRNTDEDLSLQERVDIAMKHKSDLFISLHHNAIPDHLKPLEHKGISIHYYYSHSIDIATKILAGLTASTGLNSVGLVRQNLHVLRENPDCLSVLVELGYLIHPEESEIIISSEFQQLAVRALAESVMSYTEQNLL